MENCKNYLLHVQKGKTLLTALFLVLLTATFGITNVIAQNDSLASPVGQEINADKEKSQDGFVFSPYSTDLSSSPYSVDLITAGTYAFSTQTGVALEDMSTGTTQLVGPNVDDTASALTNIGFDFWYDGVRFTQFSVNANGLAKLGAPVVSTAFSNSLANITNAPKIAPFFDDLCTGTNGKIHTKVVGSAPNRKLVVEFQNMQITRGTGCGAVGGGTFQMWLFESAATTNPGVIQFVYGAGITGSIDGGYSIGLQSGAATNFASVTTATDTVSYAVDNTTQTDAIAAGKSYLFTPNVPIAPSGLNFTAVTAISQTLNWTDNSSNEFGFVIYRSTDGTNFTFAGQTAANATSFTDTGLTPSTNYFYQVYAVTEGALSSPALSGSQATGAPGNISCVGAGGNYSDPATWGGTVPTATDNVTIISGCTVTVDTAAATAFNLTINSGGTLQSPLTGATTANTLTINNNLTNNGTLDFSTNGNTSGAILVFTGTLNATFGGTGATNNLRTLRINKGSGAITPTSPTLEINVSNLSVRGSTSGGLIGFLDTATFNGILKISGTNTFSDSVFTTNSYSIPSTAGFWLNNPNFTVVGLGGSPTLTGLLRVSNGTFNIGTGTGNSMGFGTGSRVIIEGGAVNAASRFGVSGSTSVINYSQSGGTVTVNLFGNTSTTLGSFDLGTSTASTISLTGGTIVTQLAATTIDYRNQAGSGITGVTGGTLQLGNANSGATPNNYKIRGVVPNLVLTNTSANHTATFTTIATFNHITLNITINTGTTLTLGNNVFLFAGAVLTNNGTLTHTGLSARFITFSSTVAQSYTGTGVVTVPMNSFEFQSDLGFTFDPSVTPIVTNRVINFVGDVINSNKLTVGSGGASTATIQIGNTMTPTAAGTFDSQLGFDPGSGGINITYLRTTASRVTGGEIPATRTITNLRYDDNDPTHTLTIAGGDLTATGTLTLDNGVILTGANTLTHNGTAARTNGFVDGNLRRVYTAPIAYTYFVGQNGYSPVTANVTALGTNPSSLTVKPVDATLPGLNPATSASRYWTLTEGGDLTADLSFTYIDPDDVNGNESDYRVYKLDMGALTNQCPGVPCVNAATNTASVTGITDFSDWGIGEAGSGAAGTFEFNNAAYSVSEDAGTTTITVNRTGGSGGAATVAYATSNGTATGGATCAAGIDYVNASGTLSFASGETTKTFSVTTCVDTDVEPDETVNLALTNATGGTTVGTQGTAVLTILNDDVAGPANVTVNPGNVSFATLKEAFDAINAGTHTGAVTVDINANTTETDSAVLNSSGAGAASYTSVVIRPTVNSVTVSGASGAGRGLIELNGADNVTIDGDNPNSLAGEGSAIQRNLTLQNTAANTVAYTSVIRIALNTTTVASADNNVFRNLNILGSATGLNVTGTTSTTGPANASYGILSAGKASGDTTAPDPITSVSSSAGGAIVGTGATANNLTVQNNFVNTAARAIAVQASASTVYPGLLVENNAIGNATAGDADQVYSMGVTVQGSTNAIVRGNTVYVESFIITAARALDAGGVNAAGSGTTFEKNKVMRVRSNSTRTDGAYGINLNGGNNHVIRNNFVADVRNDQTAGTAGFSTTFGAFGIRVGSGIGHFVYHNSVNMFGVLPGTTNTDLTAAFGITSNTLTGIDVRNNIFSNQLTGGNLTGTRHVAIYLPSGGTATMNLTLNNNDYFSGTDPNSRLAQVGTTFGAGEFTAANFDPSSTTPAANFRSYSSTLSADGNNDNASKKVDPLFVSNTDLHIMAMSPMQAMGATVPVTDDIDGDMRQTPPDIGADEIIGAVGMPGTLALNSATYSVGEGDGTVTVTVNRTGGTDGAVSADYSLTDTTATGGANCAGANDYINTGGTVSFADGETSQMFTVTICEDAFVEADETFNVTLINPIGGATLGTPVTAVVTIVDNDVAVPGSIQFSSSRYTGRENSTAVIAVTRTGGTSGTDTVDYITMSGTAIGGAACTAGVDYITASGTLTFNPGVQSQTFSVTLCPDATFKPGETINLALSNATGNSTLGTPSSAVLTLIDKRRIRNDYDGDGKTDYAVFRPTDNAWYILRSSDGTFQTVIFGDATDTPVPADYDGDGKTDIAVFRPSNGAWYIIESGSGGFRAEFWGIAPDYAVPGDYDGDGKADLAVWRESNGTWYIKRSTNGTLLAQAFGQSGDRPLVGDFDNDGRTELTVVRADAPASSTATVYILNTTTQTFTGTQWGFRSDKFVIGDYDGDGSDDITVFRPSNGFWYILKSSDNTLLATQWGFGTDIPLAGDYDGDGTTDLTVWRPDNGTFYSLTQSGNILSQPWGQMGDNPLSNVGGY